MNTPSNELLNINQYGVLSPPPMLWIMLLFETRHWWLSVFIAFSGQTWLFAENYTALTLAVEVPTLLVLVALSRRHPGAATIFKWLWLHGRGLVSLTAVASLALIAKEWIGLSYWSVDNEWTTLATLALHVWILMRLWLTPIMSRVFSEFPQNGPQP